MSGTTIAQCERCGGTDDVKPQKRFMHDYAVRCGLDPSIPNLCKHCPVMSIDTSLGWADIRRIVREEIERAKP